MVKRVERRNIEKLSSLSSAVFYELDPDRKQYFCETPGAWELWDETNGLPRRIKRWPKKRILWVFEK